MGRGERAENSVVAAQADGQKKKACKQNKAQTRGWAEMLKGWERQRLTACKDYLPQRP